MAQKCLQMKMGIFLVGWSIILSHFQYVDSRCWYQTRRGHVKEMDHSSAVQSQSILHILRTAICFTMKALVDICWCHWSIISIMKIHHYVTMPSLTSINMQSLVIVCQSARAHAMDRLVPKSRIPWKLTQVKIQWNDFCGLWWHGETWESGVYIYI